MKVRAKLSSILQRLAASLSKLLPVASPSRLDAAGVTRVVKFVTHAPGPEWKGGPNTETQYTAVCVAPRTYRIPSSARTYAYYRSTRVQGDRTG